MAPIPEEFRVDPEAAIASFAFTDIAEGTGVQIFLGVASTVDSTVDHHLISSGDVHSQPISTSRSSTGTTTIDFDTSVFNLPRTVRGTAFFSAGMGDVEGGGSCQLNAELFIVDSASNARSIGENVSGQVFNAAGGSSNDSEMAFIPLTITKETIPLYDYQVTGNALGAKIMHTINGPGIIIGSEVIEVGKVTSNYLSVYFPKQRELRTLQSAN